MVRESAYRFGLRPGAQSLCILAAVLATAPALADALPEEEGSARHYIVVDQPLSAVLTEIGRMLGVPVRTSEAVEARVKGRQWDAEPEDILEALAGEYGLQWYFDSQTLHVSSVGEAQTKLLVVKGLTAAELSQRLLQLGVYDPRYELRDTAEGSIIRVSGPPGYVAFVEQTATALMKAGMLGNDEGFAEETPAMRSSPRSRSGPGLLRIVRGYTRFGEGGR